MDVNDMIDYFEIKLDESGKKRVVELSSLREEAEKTNEEFAKKIGMKLR